MALQIICGAASLNIKYARASDFMLQMIIDGKIQFLENDKNSGKEVNNRTDIHKQNEALVETSIWGKYSFKVVNGKRSRRHY